MRRIHALGTLALVSASMLAASSAVAQEARILTRPDARRVITFADDRPMIGVTTAAQSDRADTLGLRIEQVTKDSPADKAGLKVGDRLQAVNGVSLRADRADAGESDYSGVLNRRLQREVQGTEAGKPVELRVLSGNQSRTVRVTPAKASEVLERPAFGQGMLRSLSADRAVLGINISATGSPRDTLGVFVTSVQRDGPAEKAGIIEGDRIAAINGVSLRVAREDAEDRAVGAARVQRLEREVAKLEAGQTAELTVVTAGRSRTVRVTAVKASELPSREEFTFTIPNTIRRQFPEGGGVREFRSPEDGMRELLPRLQEMQRRLRTERSTPRATVIRSEPSRRVII